MLDELDEDEDVVELVLKEVIELEVKDVVELVLEELEELEVKDVATVILEDDEFEMTMSKWNRGLYETMGKLDSLGSICRRVAGIQRRNVQLNHHTTHAGSSNYLCLGCKWGQLWDRI
jgi:hypothetical protein